jgi:hypothetical protein
MRGKTRRAGAAIDRRGTPLRSFWQRPLRPTRRRGASENGGVSTRTLLILAALTGLLILGAFALQVVLSR